MVQKQKVPAEWTRRRTRHDPPNVDEAVAAARGLTDRVDSQVEIAAQLIGLPEEVVRPIVLTAAARLQTTRIVSARERLEAARTIVVERRSSRIRPR